MEETAEADSPHPHPGAVRANRGGYSLSEVQRRGHRERGLCGVHGQAGLGQAEIAGIELGLIDMQAERIAIRRKKTHAVFYLPIYPHLKPVLEQILKKHPTPDDPHSKLFRMKDAKKALQAACKRLKLPHFSKRNIRQVLIRRLWKSGLDRKLIAKWQGHQDGGKLILQTYREVFADDDAGYEQQQIGMIK